MAVKKHKIVSYVLVPDVQPGGPIWYFTGIVKPYKKIVEAGFNVLVPINTDKYEEALKLCFKDEAETYCEAVNDMFKSVKFHVEEHMYGDNTGSLIEAKLAEFQKEHELTNDEMTRLLQYLVKCHEMKTV